MNKIKTAINTAIEVHSGQKRDSGEPFVTHVYRVYKKLYDIGAPEHVQIAGALHDAIEDGHLTYHEIKKEFGAEVAFLVEGLTHKKKLGQSKDEYYGLMEGHASVDPWIITIKIIDKIDNFRDAETRKIQSLSKNLSETKRILKIYKKIMKTSSIIFRNVSDSIVYACIDELERVRGVIEKKQRIMRVKNRRII